MQIFYLEHSPNYWNYSFPYQIIAKREQGESLDEFYNKGFLVTRFGKDIFVLARSLRINLVEFELTSENRRIKRKTEFITSEYKEINSDTLNNEISSLAYDFYKDKSQGSGFSKKGIENIFSKGIVNTIFEFKDDNRIFGYALCLKGEKFLHYAYPFYSLDYKLKNAGIGIMQNAIEFAKENKFKYLYLGTIYTKSSLYKLQFRGLEYFDGIKWNSNLDDLKNLVNNDDSKEYYDQTLSKMKLLRSKGII